MNDQTTFDAYLDEITRTSDEQLGASLSIDYAAIAAATEPDQPGGRIVYDSSDYETDEQADEALEDFFADIMDRVFDRLIEAAHGKA